MPTMAKNELLLLLPIALALILMSGWAEAQSTEAAQYLDPHNKARRAIGVGMPDLVWNEALASYSKQWADTQISKGCTSGSHSKGPYGENLYWTTRKTYAPGNSVAWWVAEKPYYDYQLNACTQGQQCLHYTQIVWKNTKQVGCASSKCSNGGTFVVCSYSPMGNIRGQRPY